MANPSKMLEIFIIFCYFIHYSHSTISPACKECFDLMKEVKLVNEIPNSNGSESTYENNNFPISKEFLSYLSSVPISEPLKTYIQNYSVDKASNGEQETPVEFCRRQVRAE